MSNWEYDCYAENFPKDARVLYEVIDVLKEKDSFFRDCFEKIVFAGSYYKGTKVGKPDEFDLNLVIRLPVEYKTIKFEENVPGYTTLEFCDDNFLPKWHNHKKLLSKWTLDSEGNILQTLANSMFGCRYYLHHNKFRQWMEGLFSNLPSRTNENYQLKVSKSGPAFTLTVNRHDLSSPISVDLVPVLEFENAVSLKREGIYGKWFAVPKPLDIDRRLSTIHWRISFYMLERDILKKDWNGHAKPVIRQIKKLRDKYQWNFASYYIETLFLTELGRERSLNLLSMGEVQRFVHMLGRMKEACESRKILNYWDRKHNLIQHLPTAQLNNMAGILTRIIKTINADPLTIADFVLTKEELWKVQKQLDSIKNGVEYAPDLTLQLEENSSWCSIQ